MTISSRQAEREAEKLIRELIEPAEVSVEREVPSSDGEVDLIARTGRATLVFEVKSSSRTSLVAPTLDQIERRMKHLGKGAMPVLVVPYMSDGGKRLCKAAGVSWMDLSGNADIVAPGLRIRVEGRPNRHKEPGRPSTAFAPKSARLARCLLIEPTRTFSQRELASVAGLDEGFTSRIVRRLVEDDLVVRKSDGVQVRDAGLLLDAWREEYDFNKHSVAKVHLTARSGQEGLSQISGALRASKIEHAATGLAGAWALTEFASFRLVTIYVREPIPDAVAGKLGLRFEERGANVWIVEPNDDGVFHGSGLVNGVACVHPVQAYLDLGAHPERSSEAADELRKRHLAWGSA